MVGNGVKGGREEEGIKKEWTTLGKEEQRMMRRERFGEEGT